MHVTYFSMLRDKVGSCPARVVGRVCTHWVPVTRDRTSGDAKEMADKVHFILSDVDGQMMDVLVPTVSNSQREIARTLLESKGKTVVLQHLYLSVDDDKLKFPYCQRPLGARAAASSQNAAPPGIQMGHAHSLSSCATYASVMFDAGGASPNTTVQQYSGDPLPSILNIAACCRGASALAIDSDAFRHVMLLGWLGVWGIKEEDMQRRHSFGGQPDVILKGLFATDDEKFRNVEVVAWTAGGSGQRRSIMQTMLEEVRRVGFWIGRVANAEVDFRNGVMQIQVNDWMVVDAIPHLTDFPSMGRAMLQLEVDTLASNSPIEVTLMGPPGGQMPILTFDAAGDLAPFAKVTACLPGSTKEHDLELPMQLFTAAGLLPEDLPDINVWFADQQQRSASMQELQLMPIPFAQRRVIKQDNGRITDVHMPQTALTPAHLDKRQEV